MEKSQILKMKELTQIARQKDKVLPAADAFKLYPVADETHQGKMEYWNTKEKTS